MNEEVNEILDDCNQSMNKAMDALKRELGRFRTGRANLSILDGITVEYYGTPTPLNQVAALTVADPRLITVKPWEKGLLALIEKSIMTADVGLNPSSDSELIRLPIPPLTGERRKELCKNVKRTAEDSKIAIRNVRRDANDMLKSIESLPEDDLKKSLKNIQDITDQYITQIENVASTKESEILDS
ncbi:MAG TPA: ribosome recycling factor [Myxococcales bacterium]|nr:ribosome recycling factor [Myxococcales bacterium]HIN85212.1 ribosome recycling factor [Myxococcales bacterium]